MKTNKSFLVIACFLFLIHAVNAQWNPVTSGASNRLQSMVYKNNTLWAAGSGDLIKSVNGGSSWTPLGAINVSDLDFTDANNGYAAGPSGTEMRKTTDGGATWSPITAPGSVNLFGVSALNSSLVYFSGEGGVVWRTTNGGTSVDNVSTSASSVDLEDVVIINATTILTTGTDGFIRRSTNSGMSWANVYTSGGYSLYSMCFVNTTGFAVGDHGVIAKTDNGGSSWVTQVSGTTTGLNYVYFHDVDNGIAVGNGGTILRTTDGGASWFPEVSGVTTDLYCAVLLSPFVGIVGGDGGVILKKTGLTAGIDVHEPAVQFQTWWSPSGNELAVHIDGTQLNKAYHIVLFDVSGKAITAELPVTEVNNRFSLPELSPGTYTCCLFLNKEMVETRKILISR